MAQATNIVVRLDPGEHQQLGYLSAQTGTSRSKLLRLGLAGLWPRDPNTLAVEAASLFDGRSRKKADRPGANRTAVKVADEERHDGHSIEAV